MSTTKHFINEAIRKEELDAFLAKDLERAEYSGVELNKTPMGTRVIVYASKPGIVIGRRGSNIRELTRKLEKKFNLSNPQIAVSEVEAPELNPRVMAYRVGEGLQRGLHFRRMGFWALNRIVNAGALGVEIVIRGKLTSRRHRYEKYREGYIPKSGDPALKNAKTATTCVKLKRGVLGVKVTIIPPGAVIPDKVQLKPSAELEDADVDVPLDANSEEVESKSEED
jgi:small subunit ribosomal protein S3